MNKGFQLPFLALSVLLVFSISVVKPNTAMAAKEIVRYTGDGKLNSPISTSKVLVKFKDGLSKSSISAVLAKEPLLEPLTDEMMLPSPKIVVAELKGIATEQQIFELIIRLHKHESVVYANPFLVNEDGTLEAAQDRVIVKLKSLGDLRTLEDQLKSAGATIEKSYEADQLVYFVQVTKRSSFKALELATNLTESKLFAYAEPDYLKLLKRFNTNDTFLANQWSLNNTGSSLQFSGTPGADMKVFSAWGVSTGSATIKVAILDEGVDLVHPDLLANMLPGFDGTQQGSGGAMQGNDAHGTACAGIVAAVGNNNLGVAGVAYNSKIVPVRIAYSSGSSWVTSSTWIGTSLDWAWNQGGADVLSNSWGGGSNSSLINDAISRSVTQGRGGKGAPVLFAAGNSNGAVCYTSKF
jgi:hypothetical protein